MKTKKQLIQVLILLSIIAVVGILLWQVKAGTWKTNPSATSRITILPILEYTYKKAITFNTTSTGAAVATSQSNFPIAVHINSSSWPTTADRNHFFSDTYNPNGKRVKFFDSDETTALSYEVEFYDTATQEALYWVRVPQIDGNSSTDHIHIGYGNDPNGFNQDNKTGVWDSNFKMVQHLGDNSWGVAPEAKDSTSNAHNGTNSGTTDGTGQIKQGRDFSDTAQVITLVNSADYDFGTENFYISYWIKADSLTSYRGYLGATDYPASGNNWTIYTLTTGVMKMSTDGASTDKVTSGSSAIATGSMYHVLVSRVGTGSTDLNFYINGAAGSSPASGNVTLSSHGTGIYIGRYYTNYDGLYVDGIMDEIRIMKGVGATADWAKLEYYSMKKTNWNGDNGVSSPFITYGTEQSTRGAGSKKTTILGKAIQAYTYKKSITFNTTSTGANITASQANFPIAVHLNTSSWPTQAERDAFFDNAGTDGKRVNFFDTDQDTALSYEVEYFNNTQGAEEALYWVKVPQIDANSSTDKIYIAYGNDPYKADMSNPQAVWDTNFKMVQHLGDNSWGASPEAKDSTVNVYNGTNTGSTDATGQVRRGRNFGSGVTDNVSIPNNSDFNFGTGDFTVSFWVNFNTVGAWSTLYAKDTMNGGAGGGYLFDLNGSSKFTLWNQGTGWPTFSGNTTPTAGVWYHVTLARNTNVFTLYLNGASDGTATNAGTMNGNATPFVFGGGWPVVPTWSANAHIDEFHVSKGIGRSADWLKLEYYSMKKTNYNGDNGVSSPFITFGSQELTR